MDDLVEKLLNSRNKVLEAAGRELPKWKKLKHNKQDLELFLQFNIAHIKYKPKGDVVMKDIVCTSSTRFIAVFSMLRESDKKRALKKTREDGIRTKDKNSILTYNLLDNTYNTIDLSLWQVVNFLTITPDNIEILDTVINDMLRRPVERDLSESGSSADDAQKKSKKSK